MFRSVLTKGLQAARFDIKMAKCSTLPTFQTLALSTPKPFVVHVELNRPDKLNAMNHKMWLEIGECFDALAVNPDCRVIVLSGAGPKLFSAGIDLKDMIFVGSELAKLDDVARKCYYLYNRIKAYQNSLTSLEKCPKPVIAAIHGPCVGGAADLVCCADIRYCSSDAWFQIKEVDIGMAADVGTLQRLPKIVGSTSLVNELVLTARKYPAAEAKETGFVSRVFDNKDSLLKEALTIAESIAQKSPVAVQGTKKSIVFSRDHAVEEGLEQIAFYNMTMIQSEDFLNAVTAAATKGDPPVFSKL